MLCKICNQPSQHVFKATVLKKHEINVFKCNSCEFVQTEDPFWLKEAYQSAIGKTDTGILVRNQKMAATTTLLLRSYFRSNERFLDYAGGFGLLTRTLRDYGLDFYWLDPYSPNILSRGFEHKENTQYEAATCFEGFEHFIKPLEDTEKIFSFTENILFSTNLIPQKTPKPNEWWYYAFHGGQHVSFYTPKSLATIAKKFNKNFYTNNRNIHLFTRKKLNKTLFTILTYLPYLIPNPTLTLGLKSKTISDSKIV